MNEELITEGENLIQDIDNKMAKLDKITDADYDKSEKDFIKLVEDTVSSDDSSSRKFNDVLKKMDKKLGIDRETCLLYTSDIDVVVHPQSIIHSMVSFKDSSVISQMGCPDMRLPIVYALTYPERIETDYELSLIHIFKIYYWLWRKAI